MMKALALSLMIAAALTASAQRTTRPKLRLDTTPQTQAVADTIAESKITVSGYEKTLRSMRESFLATNESADTVGTIAVTIDYLDANGRQLHRRSLVLAAPEPMAPGQTRLFEFKSWDAQRVWYYRLSERPHTKGQATPYDVAITVDYALKP